MYVCMYVCMYACLFVCVCVYVWLQGINRRENNEYKSWETFEYSLDWTTKATKV